MPDRVSGIGTVRHGAKQVGVESTTRRAGAGPAPMLARSRQSLDPGLVRRSGCEAPQRGVYNRGFALDLRFVPIDKPHSAASERNRTPILAVLQRHFARCRRVLEIGSGTGQHAVHFAAAMPWLQWQASDRAEHLPGIRQWRDEANLPNLPSPIDLEVAHGLWPAPGFDAGFSSNTVHILHWAEVEAMFAGLDRVLGAAATLVLYGPFHRDGRPTSASNAAFDASLRARDPGMGVRDAEAVHALAASIGLRCIEDVAMPANNACLVWRRG